MLLCAAFIVVPPIQVMAEELTDEEPIYYDTEEGRFVNDIDEYLSQLNDGVITSYAPILEDHESETAPYGAVSPPSKDCSNIFGHSWGGLGKLGGIRHNAPSFWTLHTCNEEMAFLRKNLLWS